MKKNDEFDICKKAEEMLYKNIGIKSQEKKEIQKNSFIRYVIKPIINFRKLINNSLNDSIYGTKIELDFDQTFANDDIVITIQINGNIVKVIRKEKRI